MGYRKSRIPIRTKEGIEYRDGYKFDSCHENFYEHQTAEFQAMLKEGAK